MLNTVCSQLLKFEKYDNIQRELFFSLGGSSQRSTWKHGTAISWCAEWKVSKDRSMTDSYQTYQIRHMSIFKKKKESSSHYLKLKTSIQAMLGAGKHSRVWWTYLSPDTNHSPISKNLASCTPAFLAKVSYLSLFCYLFLCFFGWSCESVCLWTSKNII